MSASLLSRRNQSPDNGTLKEESISSATNPKLVVTKSQYIKDKAQSLFIIALILLIVIIGFQMTDPDAYNNLKQTENNTITLSTIVTTPSPTEPPKEDKDIEIIVHEDDGDVEVDVPNQIPPDMPNSKTLKQSLKTLANLRNKHRLRTHKNMTDPQMNAHKLNPIKPSKTKTVNYERKQIINIRANHEQENIQNMPSIKEMSEDQSRRFYSALNSPAQLYGYDTQCQSCQNLKTTMISGLYNTGTNVAYRLIAPNCQTKMRFQPAWGKHEMFDDRKIIDFNTHIYPGQDELGLYDEAMLIVVVKDPLTWFKSMCKANYDFRYYNKTWFFTQCPTNVERSKFDWVPLNRAKIMNKGKNKTSNGIYESPINLWNDWYASVIERVDSSKWHYLIVRFEDLLFRVDSVVEQLCKCVGKCEYRRGVKDGKIKVADAPSKPHGNPRNRTTSFWAYSNPEYRYEGYTKEDLEYMLANINSSLLETFGYQFNVEKTMRMRL